jgi:hypothetical protein
VERAEGGALDSAEDGLGEGTPPARLGVPEEGAYEPAGPQAIERQGGRSLRKGGFQKSLALKLEKLKAAHPEAESVQIWAEDEARLGLKPVMRRMWAPVGKRPTARFNRAYEWTYLYGFVHPQSGKLFWMILPTVNTEVLSLALREFAEEVGAGKKRRILLVVDKAGWHTGGEVEVPDGIHLEFLPRFARVAAGGEAVAAQQRSRGQRALRGDRGGRANPGAALRAVARSSRNHQGAHQLPLVAPDGMIRELFNRIRYEVSS